MRKGTVTVALGLLVLACGCSAGPLEFGPPSPYYIAGVDDYATQVTVQEPHLLTGWSKSQSSPGCDFAGISVTWRENGKERTGYIAIGRIGAFERVDWSSPVTDIKSVPMTLGPPVQTSTGCWRRLWPPPADFRRW